VIAFYIQSTAQCTAISSWLAITKLCLSTVSSFDTLRRNFNCGKTGVFPTDLCLHFNIRHRNIRWQARNQMLFYELEIAFGHIIRVEINNDSINWESHLATDPDGDKFWFNKLRVASDDPEMYQRFDESSEDRTTCHILCISILNEASSNAPSSMEGVAWTEIYSTYLSDAVPNSINSDHSAHLFKSMRGVFPMIFVYGGNSMNQIPCPKYRYLFTVWIDVRS